MAGHSSGDQGVIVGINVTPMVDIVLVLLIIFIVTAKIIVTPAVEMDLPEASTASETMVVLSVIVPERGATLVDGEPITDDDELIRRAAAVRARTPTVRAVIHADGDVPHRRVIATIDALQRGGLYRIAFATLGPPASSERPEASP